MQLKWLAAILAIAASASSAGAQTSVSLSGFGSFTSTATDNGIAQSSPDQIGGLFELRHIAGPLLGFEATYSLSRANQTYKTDLNDMLCPALGCTLSTESVSASAHQITADWVPSLRLGNFRPFGIAGGGILIVVPTSGAALAYVISPCGNPNGTGPCPGSGPYTSASPSDTPASTRAVYVYGAGVDWRWLPHLGLRLQYRGNVYQSPQVTTWFSSTKSFLMHTGEPMVGVYWNF